ncbi:enoyl-CoA hydratase/isomerase family protein [Halalkalibacillus sediminis]|uniref:Ethylmalonyl-CoA decarboxylase n=1 Tax=Halalkalibacillus sediminis TaxID=2018042 RepID=A0A2I0QW38_9BACI|nr:enoyl-CoA hydratase/isomerase family protein [Halalkalibacillus sediminis]PKR78524.1 enoyl-CoA hydratase/isomerase family protein [Halalkalibacillus sediminis]
MGNVVTFEEIQDDIAVIRLNRPDKKNAISSELRIQLDEIIDNLHNNSSYKLVIFTGAGDAFCSGGDLQEFHGDISESEAYALLRPMKEVLLKLATLPMPTIAWMNGTARGGGLEIASACDLRVVAPSGNYGFVQGQLGIATGWGGGSLLYERIHPQQAFQWLIESDVRSAEQLIKNGFANYILDEFETIENSVFLTPYMQRSIQQMKWWKEQRLANMDVLELTKKMEREVEACSSLWESEAHREAVKHFFSKKK